jgi:hypothetical protein
MLKNNPFANLRSRVIFQCELIKIRGLGQSPKVSSDLTHNLVEKPTVNNVGKVAGRIA